MNKTLKELSRKLGAITCFGCAKGYPKIRDKKVKSIIWHNTWDNHNTRDNNGTIRFICSSKAKEILKLLRLEFPYNPFIWLTPGMGKSMPLKKFANRYKVKIKDLKLSIIKPKLSIIKPKNLKA